MECGGFVRCDWQKSRRRPKSVAVMMVDLPVHVPAAVRTACNAPFVSMFFDTLGQVRACCANHTFALGHLSGQRLPDIWHGPAAQKLRQALTRDDYSFGCEFCKWAVGDGTPQMAHARKYDAMPRSDSGPLWPSNLEFNLSNTCNLECPMCNGELSSAFRARRDRLPPLPKPYDDQFFADLRPFLPHVKTAQFLGGEPFLVREHYRVWDMLIEDRLTPVCGVTTNGTQFNDQVQRILDRLPISISVSLDGVRPETVAALRKNATLEQIMANVAKFHAYVQQKRTSLSFNFSLMQQNWREFGEFLQMAESWQALVYVCTVVDPSSFSLYRLPAPELRTVVETLDAQNAAVRPHLKINRSIWDETRTRLRQRLENAVEGRLDFLPSGLCDYFTDSADTADESNENRARDELAAWSYSGAVSGLYCDLTDSVVGLGSGETQFLGIEDHYCLGRNANSLFAFARIRLGPLVNILKWDIAPGRLDRVVSFTTPNGVVTNVRLIILPRREGGKLVGAVALGAMTQRPPLGD